MYSFFRCSGSRIMSSSAQNGFLSSQATQGTPRADSQKSIATQGTPGADSQKSIAPKNIVPVDIKSILTCTLETFNVEGAEVRMVIIMGEIKIRNSLSTKNNFIVDDKTGKIEVVQRMDEDKKKNWNEGSFVKVIGEVRTQNNGATKNIIAFAIREVSTQAEKDAHYIECIYSKLKLRQLQSQAGGLRPGSLNIQTFGDSKHDFVYGCIKENMSIGKGGLHRDQLFAQIKTKMTKLEMTNSLKFLASKGHIYAIMDGNLWKATQSFGDSNHDFVYGCIKESMSIGNGGLHRDQLFAQIKTKMSELEMTNSLKFLASKGHIYSIMDENLWMATDED